MIHSCSASGFTVGIYSKTLLCFKGVEGKYIRLSSNSIQGLDPPEFIVDATLGNWSRFIDSSTVTIG